MHRAGRLQADRAELLAGEGEGLVDADLAIRAMEAQRHPELGQQFATPVGIDDLDRVAGCVVAQDPQALHMAAQVRGCRMLDVVHGPHQSVRRAFLQEMPRRVLQGARNHHGRRSMRHAKAMLAMCLALCSGQAMSAEPTLDWLAGHWCSSVQDRQIDEVWLPEAGGALLGMSRTVRGARVESFEYMRIVSEAGVAQFHVQPNGVPATVFTQAARGDGWIRFENSAHDFPNRIEYRRDGDAMHAYIAGPGRDGKEMKIPFEYRLCN